MSASKTWSEWFDGLEDGSIPGSKEAWELCAVMMRLELAKSADTMKELLTIIEGYKRREVLALELVDAIAKLP